MLRGDPATVCNRFDVRFKILQIPREEPCYDEARQIFHLHRALNDITAHDRRRTTNALEFLHVTGVDNLSGRVNKADNLTAISELTV
jgi:hypothetical protein